MIEGKREEKERVRRKGEEANLAQAIFRRSDKFSLWQIPLTEKEFQLSSDTRRLHIEPFQALPWLWFNVSPTPKTSS